VSGRGVRTRRRHGRVGLCGAVTVTVRDKNKGLSRTAPLDYRSAHREDRPAHYLPSGGWIPRPIAVTLTRFPMIPAWSPGSADGAWRQARPATAMPRASRAGIGRQPRLLEARRCRATRQAATPGRCRWSRCSRLRPCTTKLVPRRQGHGLPGRRPSLDSSPRALASAGGPSSW